MAFSRQTRRGHIREPHRFNHQTDSDKKPILEINLKLNMLKSGADVCLQFPTLDPDTLHLVTYVDASLSNGKDGSSQIGYVICLADASARMSILAFKSGKSCRVVKSVMAAETLVFAAAFDAFFTLRREIEVLLGQSVPLLMFTDLKCLFDVLTSSKRTTEGRLILDVFSSRQACARHELDNVSLIKSGHNLAGALTQARGNDPLLNAMKLAKLEYRVEDDNVRN